MSKALEEILGHRFKNQELLKESITHPSVHTYGNINKFFNYERLEFLGDSVLSLVITDLLLKEFPSSEEGELAKKRAYLVRGESLSKIAKELQINQFILMSAAEENAGGRNNKNILENVMEALIGALYLDAGFERCQQFISATWKQAIKEVQVTPIEPKTFVQEWAQERDLPFPQYTVVKKSGSEHNPIFTSEICVQGYPTQVGTDSSKKNAEKAAAENFIKNIIRKNEHSRRKA